MTRKKSVVTDEPFKVSIDGKEYELKVTLNAIRAIDGTSGGILPAVHGCRQRNIDAISSVIVAGAGIAFEDQDAADAFFMKVFAEPAANYSVGLNRYLMVLINGGKQPAAEPKEQTETTEGND